MTGPCENCGQKHSQRIEAVADAKIHYSCGDDACARRVHEESYRRYWRDCVAGPWATPDYFRVRSGRDRAFADEMRR